MSKIDQRKKRQRPALFSGIIMSLLIIGLGVSGAEGSWLQKGTDVLQGLGGGGKASDLTTPEIGRGLKDALRVGTETVVSRLGETDGFNTDPAVRIPLPASLNTVNSVLRKVGMSSMLDDLETKLNRAAEEATPKAKALFSQAIQEMTLDDVQGIYNGPDDSATRYFQSKMSPELAREMKPIVEKSLANVGAVKTYDDVMQQYSSMPFVPDVKADLTDHVIDKGMDGIFYYLAREEAAIRQNPAKQTTAILKKVFGSK